MRKFSNVLTFLLLLLLSQIVIQAQTTGSIAGTVVDQNGAIVPNATIVIKGEGGQEFTANTGSNGLYKVPAVSSGLYTVTVSATGFKTSVTNSVKVDVGLPTTVDSVLEVGDIGETVEVTSGGEVLQTQTATVGTTITGRQITETPIASRDALDLVVLLPGTATVGRPRASSINGLPKGSLAITIDGVDVQDNYSRSGDGYFTYVRPRIDAIEEVTVSTANPGSESSGDGAVQIKFVTKRGTNNYRGALYWQHRNTALNANYWYLNRNPVAIDDNGKSVRQKMQLNQYGGSFGGPIPFPHFGEGGPFWHSGKDKAFFFVNYEQFRLPESQTKTRTILTPEAQAGNYSYISGGQVRTVNLFDLARTNNQLATPDPTIASMLAGIRSAVGTAGSVTPITNSPNYLYYNFTPAANVLRKFLAMRFDFNVNKNHSIEFVTNQQEFAPAKDFLNGQEERFPGYPSYGQASNRDSYAAAVRSTFGSNIVNEARFAVSTGESQFGTGMSATDFAFSRGYLLDISSAGITSPSQRNSYSSGNTPTYDFTDSVTWTTNSHTINFGGQYKLIKDTTTSISRFVPTVGFGLDSTDPAYSMFSTANLPGASSGQLSSARSLYATLIGRVLSYSTSAYLNSAGNYEENAQTTRTAKQNTYGLFAQDNWRINPSLSVNFGLRWQPQTAFRPLTSNYSKIADFADIYGVSGLGNIFTPGTLTGRAPTVVPLEIGEKAYKDDWNNFAPSFGLVWSPNFGNEGILRSAFGASGRSVFRAGYSVSFVREGMGLMDSILGSNPGRFYSASRGTTIPGSFVVGTNLRDANNPNLKPNPFPSSPNFPITLGINDSANAFSPDLETGSVHSYSLGYQRELDKNTVVEFRYVGNRGVNLQRQYNIKEFNTIENGFANEFIKAQSNLYANLAAGRGASFAYYGPNTGTSPLPIMLAYFNTPANYDPSNPARYAAGNFTNSTLVAALSRNYPYIADFSGSSFENNAARRANAVANGLPINFFYGNPSVAGAYIIDNGSKTWYDSAVVELRRRLSNGLRVQASYVFSKALSNAYASSSVVYAGFTQRENGLDLAKNVQPFDVRHNFKFDATVELPFGRGRRFLSNSHWLVDSFLGGWTIHPTIRWQSGSPISFGNVQLVGMTVKEFQKEIKVRKGPDVVTYLPDDIILNTQRAFDTSVTSASGYGSTYGGAPEGRFIAPAGYGNCISRYTGECGFNNLIVYGPSFFNIDASLSKRFRIDEKRNVELRAIFLDALNAPNFRVGGWGADTVVAGVGGSTFGQMSNGSAYQDVSTTNNPGGRIIDIILRINF